MCHVMARDLLQGYFATPMLDRILDLFERHKYGVIGTLMLHTMLLFVLNISNVDNRTAPGVPEPIELDLSSDMPEPVPPETQPGEAPATAQDVTNLASNSTADPAEQRISRATQERLAQNADKDLHDMEKEEFDRLAEKRKAEGKEITVPTLDPSKFDKSNYMEKAQKPVKVKGLTTVSYDLVGRSDIVLEVPAYLCKGSGKVVVRVAVDRTGQVLKAELDQASTTTVDACMLDNALSSAGGARFTSSATAAQPQRGTITYIFLAQ